MIPRNKDGTYIVSDDATGYTTIEEEGAGLPQRTTINFVGAGVTAADVAGETVVTISGGGGDYNTVENAGVAVTQRTTINLPAGSGLIAADVGAKTELIASGLTTANLSAAAGIVGTQLSATAAIAGTQLSATAAIAATQLAAGGAGNVLLGGASNSWGQVTTSQISAAAGIVGTQLAAGAGILGSQLSATAAIVGTQLSATAAIAGTQLAAAAAIAASQLASGGANTVLQGGTPNTWTAAPTVTTLNATTVATTNATVAGFLAFGADPADSGAVRLSHAQGVYGESSAPGTDRALATWGVVAADTAAFGDAATATQINGLTVEINGASATMIEATEIAAGRRVVFLALGADGTTTEMAANTGDRVLAIANCATAPTAPGVGVVIVYGEAGALKGYGTSSTVTTIAAAEPHCPRCGNDYIFEARNDVRGHHVAICWTCFLAEAQAHGLDRSKFAFIDKLGEVA